MSEPRPETEPSPPNLQIKVQVPDDLAAGRLADAALVGFCEKPLGREFRLLFLQLRTVFNDAGELLVEPGPPAVVHAPVVLHPENAKRLATALSQNVARFVARFGASPCTAGAAVRTGGPASGVGLPAVYANLIMVNHRPSEFTLDFLFVPPNPPFARVVQRIILAPGVAAALAADLERVVGEYEARFGPIPLTPFPGGPIVH